MIITPDTRTVSQLLSSRCRFNIPRFQREYSWEKIQYEEFLQDIIRGLKIKDKTISFTPYFLGTMLLLGRLDSPGNTLDVVDGQQRLTIITIMFSAISDHFREIKKDNLSELIFQYIMTQDDNGNQVRVLKSNTHYPFFSYYIQDREKKDKKDPVSEEENCIKETYDYLFLETSEDRLRTRLRNYFGNDDIDSILYEDLLKAIRDQILNSLVIIVTTDDNKEANVIFEILNAKGKHLASVDLIKNQIFGVLSTTEPADYADITWNEIKSILYSGTEAIGMATFFRHYWASKYSSSTENNLFSKFKSCIKPANAETYKAFLEDLKKNASYYMRIINPDRKDYNNRKEYYWLVQSLGYLSNVFNIVQIRTPLIALLDAKERGVLESKEFKELVLYIEGFHFVYNSLLARKANALDSPYSSFARNLRKCENKSDANKVIKTLVLSLEKKYPSFEEFKPEFITLYFSKIEQPGNMKAKYVINKLACYHSSSKRDYFFDDGSIEHIYPESQGSETVLSIGNLILLEVSLNNDAGTDAYEKKREIYKKSKYDWMKNFVKQNKSWDLDMIPKRAEKMAKEFYYGVLGRKK